MFLNVYEKPTSSINRPLFQSSMQLLSKHLLQLCINITIRFLEYMATCLELHLGHLQANTLKKIQLHVELIY